jgi:hypothetical protein
MKLYYHQTDGGAEYYSTTHTQQARKMTPPLTVSPSVKESFIIVRIIGLKIATKYS